MDKEAKISGRCKPEESRDNGRIITSLLPLLSVLTLDNMCPEIIRHILQVQTFLTLKDLKDLIFFRYRLFIL